MALLVDTFRSAESRVTKAVVAVDLTSSTAMKELQPEATWISTYGWFFDLAKQSAQKFGGVIVKYLGDGVMIVFGEDDAADAINCAIAIQEGIEEARDDRLVECQCSIGIAYGMVVEFETAEGAKDYIGSVADKAFRLCTAANANAIFVDTDTLAAAAMNKVRSRLGSSMVPRRTVSEYQGESQSVEAKGFMKPVPYHEILWSSTRFGVDNRFVTKLSEPPAAETTAPRPVAVLPRAGTEWLKGRVARLPDTLRQYGFIQAGEEQFWFNPSYLFYREYAEELRLGQEVWFSPMEALPNGRSRRASCILPMGEYLSGKAGHINAEKHYTFAMCTSDRGDVRQVFIYVPVPQDLKDGEEIEFVISENAKGPMGVQPRPADTSPAAEIA